MSENKQKELIYSDRKPQRMIKAIIIDLDNTMIDRQKAFKEMLERKFHILFDDEELIQKMINDILKWDNNGTVERIDVFKKWAEVYHITKISPEQLDKEWSNESGSVAFLFDDVRDTLKELKKKYKIAVLTNGNASSQRRKLNTINIYDLLDYSLVSSEYGVRKPDKKIFEYTAKQLDLKTEECSYVGDNYKIDILGSRNAGMLPVFISRNNEIHEDVLCIQTIKELLQHF
mgnify:CR=1 FL=1